MTATLAPDVQAQANARARRSILRIVERPDAAYELPPDALADFLAECRIEADTAGELHARLHPTIPCTDGRVVDTVAERLFPSATSFDLAFTHQLED